MAHIYAILLASELYIADQFLNTWGMNDNAITKNFKETSGFKKEMRRKLFWLSIIEKAILTLMFACAIFLFFLL
jgi:hypothetical protein